MALFRPFFLFVIVYFSTTSLTVGQCFQNTIEPATFHLYQTDTGPVGIVTVDLNNDNRVDMATMSPSKNTLSIWYATASGLMDQPVRIPVNNLSSLLAIELNNDNRIDLVGLDQAGDVLVLVNSKTGFSQVSAPFEGLIGATTMVQGDFNQDRFIDLAITSNGINAYRILTNTGTGSFLSGPTQLIPNSGQWIATDDFDSDGQLDLAILTYLPTSSVTIYHNSGKATFTPVSSFTVSQGPTVVSAADLNGDNKADLVVSSFIAGAFDVLLNRGHNQFELVHTEPHVSSSRPILIQDVTGDRKPDLILSHWMEARISVWVNKGNGQFEPGAYFGVGQSPNAMSAGDITGDGRPDIATANTSNSTIAVLTNKGQGQFGSASILNEVSDYSAGALGDINQDGLPDVIGLTDEPTRYNSKQLKISLNRGGGRFTPIAYQSTQAASSALTVGDLNKDGWLDVLSTNRNSNSISVMLNAKTGSGSFLAPVQYSTGGGSEPINSRLIDVNGDGSLDVATYGNHFYESLQIFLNRGDGRLIPSTKFSLSVSDVSFPDLTNDGKPDMVVISSGNSSQVRTYINQGDAQFATPSSYTIAQYVTSAVSLDMNFDGYADLLMATYDQIGLLLNQGDGTFRPFQPLLAEKYTTQLRLQDLNQDGFLDLVATKSAVEPTENGLSVYMNTGEGSFSPSIRLPTGPNAGLDTQDIDGDGRADLTALTENRLWIWYNCTDPLRYGFMTIQTGSWLDPAVWSRKRVPATTDRILLRHPVTLPAKYAAKVVHLGFEATGQLKYEAGSNLTVQN